MNPTHTISVFRLSMMAIVAIDSVKNLTFNALYGSHLVFYFSLAVALFFIPTALVTAELATTWPEVGGVYVWVREAFNKQIAFLAIWLQWLVVMIWYPSILSFIAATLTHLYDPELAANQLYIYYMIQIIFWGATFLVAKGVKLSSFVSMLSAIVGVIVPMVLLILLGAIWIYSGHPSQINEASSAHSAFALDQLRLFIILIYGLMGIELIAAHAGEVHHPQHDYPRALLIATTLIIATIIPASMAIATVVPHQNISLSTGVIETFEFFLQAFHLEQLKSLLIIMLAMGSFGIFLNWLLAASRYLLVAAQDDSLPSLLQKTNSKGMPVLQLMIQGILFSIISSALFFMPSVNSAFWLFSVAAAQYATLYYLFIFTSALVLRNKYPEKARPFRVGKHPIIIKALCMMAGASCLCAFLFGFIPPPEIKSSMTLYYELGLLGFIFFGCGSGFIIYRVCHKPVEDIEYVT